MSPASPNNPVADRTYDEDGDQRNAGPNVFSVHSKVSLSECL